jgi:hypothetical protein
VLDEEPLELPRLCTTDGLIRTACDLFPPAMLPLLAAPPLALVEDAPLLLPLNRCQPPEVACDEPVDGAEPVDPDDGPRLIADVLPDELEDGFTRCQPPVAPVDVEAEEDEPTLRAAELVGAALAAERVAGVLLADRVIACLC